MRARDPFELTLVLLVYVLPVTAGVVLLAAVGLPQLAVILLVVEAVVAGAVLLALRPQGSRTAPDAVPGTMAGTSDDPPPKG